MIGESDAEIEQLYKTNIDHIADADLKKSKQDAINAERDERDHAKSSLFITSEHKAMRNDRYIEKCIVREYAKLCDIASQLPDYISRNLENMPNNKGYKWRGVVFFGKLPEERNGNTVIFEKKFDNTLITECSPTNLTHWNKSRDGVKHLLSSFNRKTSNNRGPAKLNIKH